MTEAGTERVETVMRSSGMLRADQLYHPDNAEMIPYLDNCLRARALYNLDREYVVQNGEIIIVDEFTGRLMVGRRFSEGLHQAIEAKEGVQVRHENVTMATITFQNFFRMYDKLAGMTGTAWTEREEFEKIYELDVVVIPTNVAVVRLDQNDLVYVNERAKWRAVADEIRERISRGQPVLVGTVAIETSEHLSKLLKKEGIKHEVLNAKQHEREAGIITQAGRKGAVTIATNMAGRGVDIILGGNVEGMARDQLRRADVDLTEINQRSWTHAVEMLKHSEDPTTHYPDTWAEILRDNFVQTEQDKDFIQELGGLYVIGTERHEARRIDNQLRGRSGRLGDQGASRFYLSLEDDLMRRFGGERIAGIMSRLGVEDDLPIEAGVVSKSIENSQTKVEGYNFDIRKHVLKYDEVVNEQRNRIYEQRRRILFEPSLKTSIEDMIEQEVGGIVAGFTASDYDDEWRLDELVQALGGVFPLPEGFSDAQWKNRNSGEIEEQAIQMALDAYAAKEEEIGDEDMRRAEKQIMLWAVDNRWVRHLTDLDRLREGIGLQGIGGVDPVVAYKREAFTMYGELMDDDSKRHRQISLCHPDATAGTDIAHCQEHPHSSRRSRRRQRRGARDRAQVRSGPGAQRPLLVRQRQKVQALPHEERSERRQQSEDDRIIAARTIEASFRNNEVRHGCMVHLVVRSTRLRPVLLWFAGYARERSMQPAAMHQIDADQQRHTADNVPGRRDLTQERNRQHRREGRLAEQCGRNDRGGQTAQRIAHEQLAKDL